MDISNLTMTNSATPSVAKAGGPTNVGKSVVIQGNSLPKLPAIQQPRVNSEKSQDSTAQLNTKELQNLVEQANVTLQGRFSDLKFTVAEGTDINIVRIEDAETGEVIRQIPSETMIAIARALEEVQQGVMLEEKA